MRIQQKIHVFGIYLAMACLACSALGVSPEKQEDQQDTVYKVNQSKTYKVMVPKSGYYGSPFAPAIRLRYPTNENHFKASYVRVTIIADRKLNENKRIVLRIDEVDEKMKLIHPGLYHAYIDFMQEGVNILCRRDDDNGDYNETNINYGIPFPFLCARPPQLGFKYGSSEGQKDITGVGVRYLKNEKKDKSPVVSIEAERFENREGFGELATRTSKWYKSEADDVVKRKETKILYRENQKWTSESDWLWDEMERFDKDGNILLKCKMIQ